MHIKVGGDEKRLNKGRVYWLTKIAMKYISFLSFFSLPEPHLKMELNEISGLYFMTTVQIFLQPELNKKLHRSDHCVIQGPF